MLMLLTRHSSPINVYTVQKNKTDTQIDAMVYQLYGLTEDEIEIVENS
jgi:type II restriction/modification system DNA methylase subunit YeeA